MRRIRQLGFSDLVFPGATHSRFAHSIGVYHIARRLADVIALQRQDCDGGPRTCCAPCRAAPVLRYLTSDSPTIGTYMELDDAAMWSSLHFYRSHPDEQIARLAERLRDRNLYKFVDIGAREESGGNLYLRFRRELSESSIEWRDDLIFDDSTVTPYRWYNFEDASALSKVLVKTDNSEPKDIASISRIVASLQKEEQIRRVYAPNSAKAGEILKIVEGLRN